MIWLIKQIDYGFIEAWNDAGDPKPQALAQAKMRWKPNQPEIDRYYYLLEGEPRVRLTCVGLELEYWIGLAAMVVVGTVVSLGEFEANKHLKGRTTLNLKLQSSTLLKHPGANIVYETGTEAIKDISTQILDRRKIELVQNYQPHKHGRWVI